jgi:putative ABC transport system ATP-binding protein
MAVQPAVPSIEAPPSGQGDLIIEAVDVVKTYRSDGADVRALRGVSFNVPRGQIVAIMGPSGCGKTTLLNCLSGLDVIDGGSILVEGQDLSRLSDRRRTDFRARQMGFVFQFYNLLPVLSAIGNVEMPLLVAGLSRGEARRRALAALDTVHLRDWASHKPAQLSGGQRQRVTIARALVTDPTIVWGDEPTGDLDTQNAGEIMALITDLNRRHRQTFVIVTHAPDVAARCHRIIHMRDGQIVREEIPEGARR